MLTPITITVFLPILSESLPATALPSDAETKMTEKRLPASISEREKVCLTSGREIPTVATTIDGTRLASGAISVVGQSTCE